MASETSQRSLNIKTKIPWVSYTLVGIGILTFLSEKRAMRWGIINYMIDDYSFSWTQFVSNKLTEFPKLISHTFLHANESHLIGNMVFFLFFAPSVERVMGNLVFLVSYFLWGIAAAFTQGIFEPFGTGMIGASGAISGAAGAFFVLFPLSTPGEAFGSFLGGWTKKLPAFFLIGLWFLAQLHDAFRSLMPDPLAGQVTLIAHWAHIGGFTAGALSVFPFLFLVAQSSSAE